MESTEVRKPKLQVEFFLIDFKERSLENTRESRKESSNGKSLV